MNEFAYVEPTTGLLIVVEFRVETVTYATSNGMETRKILRSILTSGGQLCTPKDGDDPQFKELLCETPEGVYTLVRKEWL